MPRSIIPLVVTIALLPAFRTIAQPPPNGWGWTQAKCSPLQLDDVDVCQLSPNGDPVDWVFPVCRYNTSHCKAGNLPCIGAALDENGQYYRDSGGVNINNWEYYNEGIPGADFGAAFKTEISDSSAMWRNRPAECFKTKPCMCDEKQNYFQGHWQRRCISVPRAPWTPSSLPAAKVFESTGACPTTSANGPPPWVTN